MNDKIEVVMRLVAADWPNCSKGEILEHLPDMVEVADALLATAGEQESKPGHWHAVAMRQVDEIEALTARAEAAEAKAALTESIIDDLRAEVAALKAECAEAWRVHSEVVAALKAELKKYTDDLTREQAFDYFSIQRSSAADEVGVSDFDIESLHCVDAAIRRVRGSK